jgi:hypothetical protein
MNTSARFVHRHFYTVPIATCMGSLPSRTYLHRIREQISKVNIYKDTANVKVPPRPLLCRDSVTNKIASTIATVGAKEWE